MSQETCRQPLDVNQISESDRLDAPRRRKTWRTPKVIESLVSRHTTLHTGSTFDGIHPPVTHLS
jgi:hypothetical protein